ncbi:MAG: hypothetical protein WC655_21635, partial [Candidatus Hydrogenedentales bacterium]
KFVASNCKKLARRIFHTMAKFGPKLEYEQLLLANFVEVGVDLFTMASSLAYAEAHLAQEPSNQGPQELADLYCKNARTRIENNFRAVKKNHNRTFTKVGNAFMEGKYRWLCTDIVDDVPPAYRTPAPVGHHIENQIDEPAHVK